MKRYELIDNQWHTKMFESEEGDYVLYEDMIKVMDKLGWHFPIHENLRKELIMEIIEAG